MYIGWVPRAWKVSSVRSCRFFLFCDGCRSSFGDLAKDTICGQKMVRPERFELPTFWFVARRSIQLSYGRTRLQSTSAAVFPQCITAHGRLESAVMQALNFTYNRIHFTSSAVENRTRACQFRPQTGALGALHRLKMPQFCIFTHSPAAPVPAGSRAPGRAVASRRSFSLFPQSRFPVRGPA